MARIDGEIWRNGKVGRLVDCSEGERKEKNIYKIAEKSTSRNQNRNA